MIANYHTHTRWCRHATGEIEDYILEGIRNGLKALAITDHVPHRGDPDPRRLQWQEFEAFNRELDEMILRYQDQIRLIKGFECEYYPGSMDDYRMFREQYGYRIMILGQHTSKDRTVNYFSEKKEPELLLYTDEVLEGLQTGMFDFLAHPDMPMSHYEGSRAFALEQMARIFAECEKRNIPVEINANGCRGNRGYPDREIWEMSRDYQLTRLISSDAHQVKYLCDEKGVKAAEQFAEELGIRVTEWIDW